MKQASSQCLTFLHSKPVFNLEVAAIMVPVAIVTITEHIGDHLVLGSIVGRDLTKILGYIVH